MFDKPNVVDRLTALKRLKAHEAELRAMGVMSLSLFGSVARDEAGPESDVDVAAELDFSRPMGLFHFCAIAEGLEGMLGRKVDLISEPARKPRIRQAIERDRVIVF